MGLGEHGREELWPTPCSRSLTSSGRSTLTPRPEMITPLPGTPIPIYTAIFFSTYHLLEYDATHSSPLLPLERSRFMRVRVLSLFTNNYPVPACKMRSANTRYVNE